MFTTGLTHNRIHSFLGTSGQTIDDLDRYTEGCERLQLAEFTMSWRHIAPSAPDTLCEFAFSLPL
jgi:DNA polymerase delta subunit 2